MSVSHDHMRARARRPILATLLPLALAGCSGGDVLLPADPVQLRAVSGDGQSAVAGSPVPHPLVVEALDGAGRPLEGAVVRFEFVDPPDGAAIAPSAPATDPAGRAWVEVTLGTPAGDQPVDARLADPRGDVRVRFLLTAIRPATGGDGDGDGGDEGGGGDRHGDGKGRGRGNDSDNGNGSAVGDDGDDDEEDD